MDIAFSCYPLSTDLVAKLDSHANHDEMLTLNSLRALPFAKILVELRRRRADRLSVVLGEETEKTLLPILLMLASLVPANRYQIVDLPSGTVRTVSRLAAFLGIVLNVYATIMGQWARLQAEVRSRRLMNASPVQFGPLAGVKSLYLKSNLMLGTQAGGSVGHVAGIANELFRRDNRMVLMALEFPATVDPNVQFSSIAPLRYYGIPSESNHLRFNRHCIKAGMQELRTERFDFIYQRLTIANFAGVMLSRKFRVPLILEYNGSEVWVASNWGLKLAWEKLASRIEEVCFRHAYRIVVVSEVLADELKARGVPEDRIVFYPNCIDPVVFDPDRYVNDRNRIREELGIGDREIVCTFLGTFGAWHGADVLAEAINRYRQDRTGFDGPRLRFLMVGDGLLAGQCREMLADAVDSEDVIFTGIVAQAKAPAYLAASDIFVSPHVRPADGSRFFGSPTKLFEYMAMGKPIIASALEQIAAVLAPSCHIAEAERPSGPPAEALALLTQPGSEDELLRALKLLGRNPVWQSAMGERAREKALKLFTWQTHVDCILQRQERRDG
jgi:glycosyltransferase involved in cell wall biosynthesis